MYVYKFYFPSWANNKEFFSKTNIIFIHLFQIANVCVSVFVLLLMHKLLENIQCRTEQEQLQLQI